MSDADRIQQVDVRLTDGTICEIELNSNNTLYIHLDGQTVLRLGNVNTGYLVVLGQPIQLQTLKELFAEDDKNET